MERYSTKPDSTKYYMTELIEDKGTKAILRAMDILTLLGNHPNGLMLVNIAELLDLPKSTIHRILQSLVSRQIVQQDPEIEGSYRLGISILELSRSFLDGFNLVREAQPYLTELNILTNETIHLGVLDANQRWVVYLDKKDSSQAVRLASRVGQVVPLHCTALGKSILSTLSIQQVLTIFSDYEFSRYTDHTILNTEQMMKELALTRERGYALDNEEHETGVICVGAAIVNTMNEPLAAISISAPANRMQPIMLENSITAVKNVVRNFSQRIKDIPANELFKET